MESTPERLPRDSSSRHRYRTPRTEGQVLARHRSPSGPRRSTSIDAAIAPVPGRNRGAHRIPTPGPAARGRMVAAAVAVGAVAAASQGVPQQPERADGSTLLALGADSTAYSGLGGNGPALQALALPEVLPVPQDKLTEDVTSLAKGERIAEQRAAQVVAAQQVADDAIAAVKAEAERAAHQVISRLNVSAGEVVMPTVGRLTSGFGARWGTSHNGIDIANSIGTPIYATTDGVVVESGPASGFGRWVRVEHSDGTISVYGHINESLVSEGQHVAAGEQIATMGNRGQSTGPHLHFEIWLDGTEKINPLSWLRSNGVDI
ncbi:MAG: M23 family metallopeptidase [Actinobacteria bacterium]|nr:M23 family metallopeptidase [Actinomycetota bacterium]